MRVPKRAKSVLAFLNEKCFDELSTNVPDHPEFIEGPEHVEELPQVQRTNQPLAGCILRINIPIEQTEQYHIIRFYFVLSCHGHQFRIFSANGARGIIMHGFLKKSDSKSVPAPARQITTSAAA